MPNPAKKVRPNVITGPKGMHDILPSDQPLWDKIRKAVKEVSDYYNFWRIDTPLLEKAELFSRPLGETSDVVEKQMFSVNTKGGDNLVLRPEGTAPIARAYIEHGLSHLGQPLKLYYEGPMFRYEQPQAGRFRQFHQAGFEILSNENDTVYDIQVILACYRTLEALKLKEVSIQINSTGCQRCRPGFRKKLIEYYKNKEKSLCGDCKRRLKVNPLRLLDCKNEPCVELKKDSPNILDGLCFDCKRHFKKLLEFLEETKLPYSLNQYLVRGFDYYSKTVFEMFASGFDFAIAAGGRYDYLIDSLGGRQSPGVGGAIGLDRVVEVIKAKNINLLGKLKPKVFLIHMGDMAKIKAIGLVEELREAGVDVHESLGKESLKAQLKAADKLHSEWALILGQQEVFEQSIIIRDMKSGAQETVPLKKVVEVVKKKLR
ncbi:MAG: histidine--tRNA ligase [bacterium]|nr:histidine--tRNA ligase [bacterium]